MEGGALHPRIMGHVTPDESGLRRLRCRRRVYNVDLRICWALLSSGIHCRPARCEASITHGRQHMTEAKGTKKVRNITFRLTDEQYAQVEDAALSAGEDPNSWCRKVALSQLTEGVTLSKNERLLYQESALLRFLVGHGFKVLLSGNEATAANWKKLTAQADRRSDEIVEELLSRRKLSSGDG